MFIAGSIYRLGLWTMNYYADPSKSLKNDALVQPYLELSSIVRNKAI